MRAAYVFDMQPLTSERPYFAGFVKPMEIPRFLNKLETLSDEWGYLLLWATLLLSVFLGMLLLALPVFFGWKALFAHETGKLSVIVYFLCLGLGYILIEIAFIGKCILCLGNPTVSFTVLVTGMLLFSGIGSYASGRLIPLARSVIVVVCGLAGALLLLYAVLLSPLLAWIGGWAYPARVAFCLALLAPLAFLLGFPFALGMATLSKLHKEHFFVWAWGINGSFSVVGSVLAPVLSILFGLSSVLILSAAVYLLAAPCFLGFSRAVSCGETPR
jgi:hypothetical protein